MRRFLYITSLVASTWLIQPTAAQSAAAPTAAPVRAIALTTATPRIQHSQPRNYPLWVLQALLQSLNNSASWLLAMGVLSTAGAISWGVFQYASQQHWQRIDFLRQTIKEFEQTPDIQNALKILDFEEYRDYHVMDSVSGKSFSFHITEDLLCNALAHHDDRARCKHQLDYHQDHNALDAEALRQYQIETALRDWFNKMLNGLEHFGYFIESGLFTAKELEPWLNYWIKLIADPVYRRPGASRFYDALYSYIHHSGFSGVQRLFNQFGYCILPSPYKDDDLVSLDLSHQYNTRVALTLAKASYLAYQDKQFVASVVGKWGAELAREEKRTKNKEQLSKQFIRYNFRYFNNHGRDTQAYMFRTEQCMVLAFRGSQQPKDWLTNVTTQLRNFTIHKDGVVSLSSYQGRVHTGFFLAWAIIEKSVLSQLSRWQAELAAQGKTLPPLYITGHSLGGALATMAAAALCDHGVNIAGVYTFGQPRVGDRAFVNQLTQQTHGKVFRFVNNNDIVPHVPPPFSVWNPTRLYGHVGLAKYFDDSGSIRANYKLASRAFDRARGLVRGFTGSGFDLISDHSMEYYISHLNTALKEETKDKAAHMFDLP